MIRVSWYNIIINMVVNVILNMSKYINEYR